MAVNKHFMYGLSTRSKTLLPIEEFKAMGFHEVTVVNEGKLINRRTKMIDKPAIKAYVEHLEQVRLQRLIVLDIECLDLDVVDDDGHPQDKLDTYTEIVDYFHYLAPWARIGAFGEVPSSGSYLTQWCQYGDTPGPAPRGTQVGYYASRMAIWEWRQYPKAYRRSTVEGTIVSPRGLTAALDIVCPSLYVKRDNKGRMMWTPDIWRRHAEKTVAVARGYGNMVVPFICPVIPQGTGRLEPLSADMWDTQLETLCRIADGFVLWQVEGMEVGNWTKQTQEFIVNNKESDV